MPASARPVLRAREIPAEVEISLESTATNATLPASFRAATAKSGSSFWHGPHQEAKKLTTSGFPLKSASRTRPVPSMVGMSNLAVSVTLDGPDGDSLDWEDNATPATTATTAKPRRLSR